MSTLHFKLDYDEAVQLKWLMDRALNSLQPEKWPAIAQPFLTHLEKYLERGTGQERTGDGVGRAGGAPAGEVVQPVQQAGAPDAAAGAADDPNSPPW